MKFVVDECTGPLVAQWLSTKGHDVFSIYDHARGVDDDRVLEKAHTEQSVLITSDKDFGELIFREKRPHHGVVLLRLRNPTPSNHIAVLDNLLSNSLIPLVDRFVVITDGGIRVA
jgi:predicted nuclease of predicted toxin-antitoxin system